MSTDVGVVILTMGKRPVDLRRAIDSVLAQRDVNVDVVVVGNGWQPTDLPDTVASLYLPENMGIPTGRNAGVPLVSGELLFFLDDDAAVPDPNFLASIKGRF
ncbi:MAG: glycosyltransferase family 2 protein, partial [Candidatus Nanopelagicales bacterium]